MFIRIGYDIVFESPNPVPMTLLLYTHPSIASRLRSPDHVRTEPEISVTEFIDSFGNRCGRILAPLGKLRLWSDALVETADEMDEENGNAVQHDVPDLPAEILPFLLPSRYCQVDLLSDKAWNLFQNSPMGWGRVQAICDFVHSHVQFGYALTRPEKTAVDVMNEGNGVCRDFQHLAITLCRCMNIPARYATGYLGDIRIPPPPGDMDFSAWFEAYLGGRWYAFDARFNERRYGRLLMATGRDSVDCALTTAYGPATLKSFRVVAEEVSSPDAARLPHPAFEPIP